MKKLQSNYFDFLMNRSSRSFVPKRSFFMSFLMYFSMLILFPAIRILQSLEKTKSGPEIVVNSVASLLRQAMTLIP